MRIFLKFAPDNDFWGGYIMVSDAFIIVDTCEFRAAAFAAILAPWARRIDADIHVVHDPDKLADLPDHVPLACFYSIGGLSLRDQRVTQTIARLRDLFAACPHIVFSDIHDNLEIAAAIDCGLHGFIPTKMPAHIALAAIQFILDGGTYHPHSVTNAETSVKTRSPSVVVSHIGSHQTPQAASPERSQTVPPAPRWTASPDRHAASSRCDDRAYEPRQDDAPTKKRHIEVLEFLIKGETNKEIARHLDLTEATIKVYVRELMKHFGAKNRMQVALKASALRQQPCQPMKAR